MMLSIGIPMSLEWIVNNGIQVLQLGKVLEKSMWKRYTLASEFAQIYSVADKGTT